MYQIVSWNKIACIINKLIKLRRDGWTQQILEVFAKNIQNKLLKLIQNTATDKTSSVIDCY